MLKRLLVYFVIIATASACYKYDKPKKPKNLISKDKMVNIIMDIRLLSSANGTNKTTLQKNNLIAETYVFKKYDIDSLQFGSPGNQSYCERGAGIAIAYKFYDGIERYSGWADVVCDSLPRLHPEKAKGHAGES